jgi:hypothetical protein
MKTASGERLGLPKRSTMNSKLPKQMASPRVNPTQAWWWLLVTVMSFGEWTIKMFRGKLATKIPLLGVPTISDFYIDK